MPIKPETTTYISSDKTNSLELVTPIPPTQLTQLEQAAELIILEAESLIVDSQLSYNLAAEFISGQINSGLKLVSEIYDDNVKRWHEGHKQAIKDRSKLLSPFQKAERIIKDKMIEFSTAERNKQKEQQRQLLDSLQSTAEERASDKINELLSTGTEEDRVKAEKLAEKLINGEVKPKIDVPIVEPKGLKSNFSSTRILKRFRVTDRNKINRNYLVPDMRLIQSVVDEKGKEAEEIVSGIEYFEEESIAVKRK